MKGLDSTIRILLIPPALFFGWWGIRSLLVVGSVSLEDILSPVTAIIILPLILSYFCFRAITSSVPVWKSEGLVSIFVLVLGILYALVLFVGSILLAGKLALCIFDQDSIAYRICLAILVLTVMGLGSLVFDKVERAIKKKSRQGYRNQQQDKGKGH